MALPRENNHRQRIAFLAIMLLLLLASGLALLASGYRSSGNEQETKARRVLPNTDVSPYGANFFLTQEVEEWKLKKTLQMAQDAGIGWARQQFPWVEIEPQKGKFVDERTQRSTWGKFDHIVELCDSYGIRVISRLDAPPVWARSQPGLGRGPLHEPSDFGDFVYAFVSHFKGRIQYIQLWNEPNLWYEWGDNTPDARQYVEMLRIGFQRAKEADPSVFVVSAPLAQTLERSPRAVPDLDYLEEMYREGAKEYFDILGANAFGFDRPPDDPASPQALNFARAELLREIMVRNGDAGKPVWLGEYGWNASPEGYPPEWYIWRRVNEEQQAEYTARGIQKARAEWDWVGVVNIWYFRQVGLIPPDRSEYYFRLVDVDFTPRLAIHAIKRDAKSLSLAGPGYYEETAPPVTTLGSWQRPVEAQASGGSYLATSTAGASVGFSFFGDTLRLITAKGPQGGMLQVTVDGREANALPRDKRGRAILDLYSPIPYWQEGVVVARGLGPGEHKARLTASGDRNPAATGNRCVIDALEVLAGGTPAWYYWAWGLVLAGLVLDLGLLWTHRKRRST